MTIKGRMAPQTKLESGTCRPGWTLTSEEDTVGVGSRGGQASRMASPLTVSSSWGLAADVWHARHGGRLACAGQHAAKGRMLVPGS